MKGGSELSWPHARRDLRRLAPGPRMAVLVFWESNTRMWMEDIAMKRHRHSLSSPPVSSVGASVVECG
jgi:hypothetical protein